MRMFLPVVLLLAALAASCSATPSHPIAVRLDYGEKSGPPLRFTATVDPADVPRRSAEITIGRVPVPEGPVAFGPAGESENDARQALRLAQAVQRVLRSEIGPEAGKGIVVLLFRFAAPAACSIEATIPAESGIAFGVPSVNGEIPREAASELVYGLAREYVRTFLTDRILGGGCNLIHREPEGAWIADGVGRIVAAKSLAVAVKDGLDLAPRSYVFILEEELKKGLRPVSASRSSSRAPGDPDGEDSAREAILRVAAGEYVCYRWYSASRRRGQERPIEALVEWLRRYPLGPTYERVLDFLRRMSALSIADESAAAPLDRILEYHRMVWKGVGWRQEGAK